ncbi:50S ribosomal protein L11 methyltransferase [Campylobacter pinnipediorum]|uniref:Ribosomal protein L11 methyltransferase n=1 Tax=Campylobacter pinnipediorum subsp. pinnipediorum TaxID=1660067 RepID=A0AAX0LCI0_9BACT|nr:50S ribosomal protein L11 methyltransferase [Campylobacter pinnipediorum]AQW81622.1 50S ribosomal protein L11 methyltransferase [Campylobacter pinnipediorum subsp. pinnipediorum]AQW83250.1 50S ribosomal protein L11 methyltransferase [Campylobacter pinnipediorum subsp. pinnipediorum]AQW84818.1 50S ribosomal protein L11 methyltransferase [Campylobacter pinnipediorum subsp. pinnipediorum]OPA79678.1 ribosomal protein L11 methyltransferase [Campylobacter pinnipediorum subsp. pinnipediorum]OPA817
MRDNFYELSVKTLKFYPEILEFIFLLGFTCVEECENNEILLRDESDLSEVEWGIKEYIDRICQTLNIDSDLVTNLSIRENKDWINEYKQAIKPILLDNFYIRPSWEKELDGVQNIIIDPALAFGSGHHESTSSCVLFLQKYAKRNLHTIDVGCGSGILSILMSKLGCVVDACDTDEQAVKSSIENAKLNNVKYNKIWTGSISNLNIKYDIVVANIIADVIFMLEKDLKNILKDGAYLVLSGILAKYETRIKDTFKEFELVEQKQLNDWVSFVFKK